jgi:capsular exopolysaccharide synthesis family protein
MGRLDDALRRANLDVSRDTGAPAPAPSPWEFEPQKGAAAAEAAGSVPAEPPAEAARRSLPVKAASPARRDGFNAGANPRLVLSKNAAPLHVEQFRSLAATLHQAQLQQPLKTVIVTSASPGDGKSHVAVNLALTLSESYRRRVLLIDADLRRPSLHQVLQVPNTGGLSAALKSKTDGVVETDSITEGLALLPAGRPDDNPLAVLASDRMKRIIADAASHFDWVIVDAPPVGVLADARLAAETVDAAILVVRAGVTGFPDLEAAADMMGHERILGVVLNAVDPVEIRGQDYYYHYHHRDESGRS